MHIRGSKKRGIFIKTSEGVKRIFQGSGKQSNTQSKKPGIFIKSLQNYFLVWYKFEMRRKIVFKFVLVSQECIVLNQRTEAFS